MCKHLFQTHKMNEKNGVSLTYAQKIQNENKNQKHDTCYFKSN